ncbi:MAG: hypothetical protein Q8N90_04135 [bacterium]|nr:hypothetical protein [bacterium]
MKKIALYVLPITLGIFLTGFLAQAQIPSPPPTGLITSVSGVWNFVNTIVKWVYWFFFAMAVLFIVFAAFSYLTAGGDPGKVKKANTQLIYAIVAIAVALIAYGIEALVRSALTSG